jgi:hypothetical protein
MFRRAQYESRPARHSAAVAAISSLQLFPVPLGDVFLAGRNILAACRLAGIRNRT